MKKDILIIILFIIIAVAMTFPLAFKINSSIPGFFSTDETYGALRQFWWYKYSWSHKVSYQNDFMFSAPFGFQNQRLFIYPLFAVAARWFSILTNEILAYNLIFYLNLLLSAFFMYYLSYYLIKSRLSGILAGIIYAFCPYYFARAWQHLGLTQIQWFPLYILALFKLRQKMSLANTVLVALVFALLLSSDNQYAYFMLVASFAFIIFVLAYHWKIKLKTTSCLKDDWKLIRMLFFSGILSLLLSVPALYSMLGDIFTHSNGAPSAYNLARRPFEDLFTQSVKPLSYFLPAAVHPIFGNFTQGFVGSQLYGMSYTEHTLYLGWVPLILAFIAFKKWRKSGDFYLGFFIFLAMVSWFFSQPPWWQFGPIKIYMPSFFMYKILPMFRAYCRFGILVMFAVAALAGFGLKSILERFKTTKSKIVITSLFCVFLLFEFWNYPPFKVIDVSKNPTAYSWLKEQPGIFTIAEYPMDVDSPNEMYKFYQTKHEKKIINGSIPGTYVNKVAKTITQLSSPDTAKALKWMGVKFVLVHTKDYENTGIVEWVEELKKIPQNPGIKLVKSLDNIDVYEIIASPKKPEIE